MEHFTIPLIVIGYAVLLYFFFLFYKNYKSISSIDSTKGLMQQILKTRRTVKNYVIFNLVFLYISIVIGLLIELNNNPDVVMLTAEFNSTGDYLIFYGIIIILTLIMMALLTALLLGFYFLVYGILLKKLKNNYKELQTIEADTD